LEILYGVSSVGLGHSRRSLKVARELKKLGNYKISWISAEPSIKFFQESHENVLSICSELKSLSTAMENRIRRGRLEDISRVARTSSGLGRENYSMIRPKLGGFDALIQDEFVETMFAFMWEKSPPLPKKNVIITDYYLLKTSSRNPLNRIVTWYANRMLAKAYRRSGLRIFADETQEPSNEHFNFEIVGPIIGDLPVQTREQLREKLMGNQDGLVIVVSIGGTSAGTSLLDFMKANQDSLQRILGPVVLVFLLGPRVDRRLYPPDSSRMKFVTFTTDSLSHFKAADCVVTQAGASTLNEVAALGTPCVAVPIANHWEQEDNASRFSKKCGFQVVQYSSLTPAVMAQAITKALESRYRPLNSNGGRRAAELIHNYLTN
jgi:predicted glycosyltransferase